MANFQRFLRYRLDKYQLDIKSLNSRKNTAKRIEVLEYLLKLGIAENLSERKLLKEIRATGLKFSNEIGRAKFSQLNKQYGRKKENKTGKYLQSIRKDSKFNPSRIPSIEYSSKGKKYLYVAQFFFLCDDKKLKKRKLKRDKFIVRSSETTSFNRIQEYGFWSDDNLSRNEVEQFFIEWIDGGLDVNFEFDSPIAGSNWHDTDFSLCDIAGFKYIRVVKAKS